MREDRRSALVRHWWIGAFALVAAPAAAEPLSWIDAMREAVQWHPAIAQSAGELRAQAEDVAVARAGYHPQLSAGIEAGPGREGAFSQSWRPRASLSGTWMLHDFGKVAGAVAAAEAGTAAARAALLLAMDSLIRDASQAVIEVRRAAALRAVAVDQLRSVGDISMLVERRARAGASTRSDALQAQARVQAARATLQQVEAEGRRWQGNLAFMIGRAEAPEIVGEAPTMLEGACARSEPDWAEVPAAMEARARRDQAQAAWRRSQAERLPTVSLGASGHAYARDPVLRRGDYQVGISISSALLSGGARKARARGAAFAVDAADAAEARVRTETERLLAEAREQVTSLTLMAGTLAARQASMDETGRLYRRQYLEMGTRTLVDLLNAEQELHQVRFDLVNARYEMLRQEVDCLFRSGRQRTAFGLTGMTVRGVVL